MSSAKDTDGSYHTDNDCTTTCQICQEKLSDSCESCHYNDDFDTSDCIIAKGTCGHHFHFHCISRRIKSHAVCPIDQIDWVFEEYIHNVDNL